MATDRDSRQSKRKPFLVSFGTYKIAELGNSKGVRCFKKLDSYSFPSDPGDEVLVELCEGGAGDKPMLIITPADSTISES